MTQHDEISRTSISESQAIVTATRVRESMESLFHERARSWFSSYGASDVLGSDQACQVKVWMVGAAPEHLAVAMVFTDVLDRASSAGPVMPNWKTYASRLAGKTQGLQAPSRDERRDQAADEDQVRRDLRRARGLRELGEIESRRAIWRAHCLGLPQRLIGDLVGRSQPDVGRTVKKVDSDLSVAEVTPREIALRRLVGEYTDIEMLARLLALTYMQGESDPSELGGGFIPGTWDEVRALRDDDLIAETEWQELFKAKVGESQDAPPPLVLPAGEE